MCSNCRGEYEDPEMTDDDSDDQPDLQTWLERCYMISLLRERGLTFPSPLVSKHKMDFSWEDLS